MTAPSIKVSFTHGPRHSYLEVTQVVDILMALADAGNLPELRLVAARLLRLSVEGRGNPDNYNITPEEL